MIKIIRVVIITAIIGATGYMLYQLNRQASTYSDPLHAIPEDAGLIIKINDYEELTRNLSRESHIWQEMIRFPYFAKLDTLIHDIDSLASSQPELERLINQSAPFISGHQVGNGRLDFVFIVPQAGPLSLNDVTDILSLPDSGISERKYDGALIYTLHIQETTIYLSIIDHLYIFSSSELLLEKAIRQTNLESSLRDHPSFVSILESSGKNVPANVYLNYEKIPEILALPLKEKYRTPVAGTHRAGGWSTLDVHINDEEFMLNGFVQTADSLVSLFNILQHQSPGESELPKVLPANTSAYLSLCFDDFEKLQFDLNVYYNKQDNEKEASLERIRKTYDINLKSQVSRWIGNEAAQVFTNLQGNSSYENTYLLLKTRSASATKQSLEDMLATMSEKNNVSPKKFVQDLQIDSDYSLPMYHFPVSGFTKALFGNIFKSMANKYGVVLHNFLVLGNSPQALQRFVHYYVLEKTLSNDLGFTEHIEYADDAHNFFFYIRFNESESVLRDYLEPTMFQSIFKHPGVFRKIQAFGYQLSTSGDLLYNNTFLKYSPEYEEKPHTIWETLLDTTTHFKPAFVKNHYTRRNEIFIQDEKHNCYLINRVGRKLWKLPLDEAIIGDVHQVDYYKNGKLQLLFNTKSAIHLIDRNGNYVERYPVKLRSEATNGLGLFDYENNKKYRIFIAGKDKKIYVYNIEGDIVPGWSFGKTSQEVKHPVRHMRIGTKDYIVFTDGQQIYIQNRRGETRVEVPWLIEQPGKNPLFYQPAKNPDDAHIVTTDNSGLVWFISFSGEMDTLRFANMPSNHYFEYQKFNEDPEKDFIFVYENMLKVYNKEGETLLVRDFEEEISVRPVVYDFSSTVHRIGIVEQERRQIHLIRQNGSNYKGFPLKGHAAFSIGRFNYSSPRFNLVVGNKDNFLLNYSVK